MTRLLVLACLLGVPASALAQPPAATIEYYHLDALGSVRAVTDAQGQVVRRHDYLPFGEEFAAQPGADPVRFTGKERDRETGLDYFGARYLHARWGRFTTVDPLLGAELALVDPQRWNRYSYVGNRPLKLVDPDGRGWASTLLKLVVKGGDVAATVSGVVEDIRTVFDSSEGTGSRLLALGSLASELLPVSGRDVVEGVQLGASFAMRHGDDASRFTRSTFRDNLGRVTGGIQEGAHAHHMLPLKFGDQFKAAGLSVNDPRYGAWWSAQDHLRNAKGYNDRWRAFFRNNPNTSADDILRFGEQLASDYGLKINY